MTGTAPRFQRGPSHRVLQSQDFEVGVSQRALLLQVRGEVNFAREAVVKISRVSINCGQYHILFFSMQEMSGNFRIVQLHAAERAKSHEAGLVSLDGTW